MISNPDIMLQALTTFLGILLAFLIWVDLIILLDRMGILEKYNMSRIWGFALMWRTKKGTGFIEKVSSFKKLWTWLGNIGIVLFFTGMLFMFIMIAISAFITLTNPAIQAVGADEVLVLPGINPYVPFIYGLVGLIVAVVAHELSHGIIARVEGFKVKALGLLFILIPMGAFMEPDEKEVEKGPRKSRIRMFTAGPISNFFLAFLFIGLFSWGFMGSLEAPDDPFIITDLGKTSAIHIGMDETPKAIYSINGTEVHSVKDMLEGDFGHPGNWSIIEMKINGGREFIPFQIGLVISTVVDDSPADESGMIEGSIISTFNGTPVKNYKVFTDLLDDTKKDQVIQLGVLEPVLDTNGDILLEGNAPQNMANEDIVVRYPTYIEKEFNITLDDKHEHIQLSMNRGKGYIGIASSFLGVAGVGSEEFIDSIAHPISTGDGMQGKFRNLIYITFVLPLELSIMPFHDPITDIYEVNGPLGILPGNVFWFMANTIFYVFWINILLGLFNALPMVPLDGGFVFRDGLVLVQKKFRKDVPEEKLEALAKRISKYISITVLVLILTSIFFPWVRIILLS